jgi:GT2 family glycosyltransferase
MEETQIPLQCSVLIVSYNQADVLRRCLAALERSAARETFEIIVIDNGSLDESVSVVAEFPSVTPLRLPRNFGFVKALNIGMRTAKGDFFLFLNPKTEVLPDTVQALTARLAQEKDAVGLCPALATPAGDPVPNCYRLPRPENIGAITRAGVFDPAPLPSEDVTAVEFAGFAALMVRAYFLKGLRYIDERYSQSWADAEIGAQIRRAGKKTLVIPGVRAVWHGEDRLSASMPEPARTLLDAEWALGAAVFAGKHFGYMAGLKVRIATALAALLSFQFRRFSYLLSGQRIDGTQTVL